MDVLVTPNSMMLQHLIPQPAPRAVDVVKPDEEDFSISKQLFWVISMPFKWYFASNATNTSSISPLSESINATVISDESIDEEFGDNNPDAEEEPDELPTPASVSKDRLWNIIELRSSMLDGVNIPMDHEAILWCFQFLSTLSTAMKSLSNSSADDWISFFPLASGVNATYPILVNDTTLSHYRLQLDRQQQWRRFDRQERSYMINRITSSTDEAPNSVIYLIHGIIMEVFTSHLWKIVPCYIMQAIFIIASPTTRLLSGYLDPAALPTSAMHGIWTLFRHMLIQISPSYHWHWDIFTSAYTRWSRAASGNLMLNPIIVALSLSAMTIPLLYDLSNLSASWRIDTVMWLSTLLSWAICYALATICRLALIVIFLAIRLLFGWIRYLPFISSLVSRHTSSSSFLVAWRDARMMMLYTILILVTFLSRCMQRTSTLPYRPPIFLYMVTIISLGLAISLLCNIFLLVIKSSSVTALAMYQPLELMNFALLYIVVIPLALPMSSFSMKVLLLQHDPISLRGNLLSLYHEIFTYGICIQSVGLLCLFIHTTLLLNDYCYFDVKVKPSATIVRYLGPLSESMRCIAKSTGQDDESSMATTVCLHEDGGKYAIFEAVEVSLSDHFFIDYNDL
jgi:hypothetical protein